MGVSQPQLAAPQEQSPYEQRKTMNTLMNPHGLPTRRVAGEESKSSFLRHVWGETTAISPPGIQTEPRPPVTAESISARAWREMAKPNILNPNPSTDDVPLPTRTAAPTVTRFDPAMAVTLHTAPGTRYKDDVQRRHVDRQHVSELLSALRSPAEHSTQSHSTANRSAALTLAPSFEHFTPPRQPRRGVVDLNPDESRRSPPRVSVTQSGYTPQYLLDIVEALEM
jgi:hypothetical protein